MTKQIMENIIKYKNLEPTEETEEAAALNGGKTTVTMPDYTDSSIYNVALDLEGKGLTYKVVGTGNTITNQVPKAEGEAGTAKVPNVVGKSYTEAVKTLSDAGFEVTFEGETTNSTVTAQDPKYGVSVEADSEVKITLTKKEAAEETAEELKKTTQ